MDCFAASTPSYKWEGYTAPSEEKAQYTFAILGSAFTPETIRASTIQRGDRPYGSIFGASATRTTHDDKNDEYAWTSQLILGALGLDVSKNTQSELHRFLRRRCSCLTPYAPQGWHNQISDGGEVTGLYRCSISDTSRRRICLIRTIRFGWSSWRTVKARPATTRMPRLAGACGLV